MSDDRENQETDTEDLGIYNSVEARDRALSKLKPAKKGEVRNPWGRAGKPSNRRGERDPMEWLNDPSMLDPMLFKMAVYSGNKDILIQSGMSDEAIENIDINHKLKAATDVTKYLYNPLGAIKPDDGKDSEKDVGQQTIIVIPSNQRETDELISGSKKALKDSEFKGVVLDLPPLEDEEGSEESE